MSDPSERFTDVLPCGCERHAGSWLPCAQHRACPSPTERAEHQTPAEAVAQLLATPALALRPGRYPFDEEGALEQLRNIAMILSVAEVLPHGARRLTEQEYQAVRQRLARAEHLLAVRVR